MLSGSNYFHIQNLTSDSIEVIVNLRVLNQSKTLYHDYVTNTKTKDIEIPTLDTTIGELRVKLIKNKVKDTQYINKIILFVNSDVSLRIKEFDTDSMFIETTKGASQSSLELLDIVAKLNDVSNSISKNQPVNYTNQKNVMKAMNIIMTNYLTSNTTDYYKLKALEGFVSRDSRKLIGYEDLSKQLDNFKLSEWTDFYEYKKLNQYLVDYKERNRNASFDYSFIDKSGASIKIQNDTQKFKIFVFWSIPCTKECPLYFDRLKEMFNKTSQITIYTISSESNIDIWKKGLQDCDMNKWNNLYNSQGYLSPMVIDYSVPNIYNHFLILDKSNRSIFSLNNFTDFESFMNIYLKDIVK